MTEFKKPKDQQDLEKSFAQIKPLMNATMAYYESSRCLFCYDAPCVTACPTGIDIPLFIRQINTNHLKAAAKTIYEANYFGHICGKVCPTEVLCEGACVFNEQDVKPIEIGRLQSYAAYQAISDNSKLFTPDPSNDKKIAVIGGGPAGISCACELRLMGYEVDIFEAKSRPSGLALHGTAPYKITNLEVLEEVEYLQNQFGFRVIYNTPVNSKKQVEDIELKYDAVFLGIGLGYTSSAGLEDRPLKNCFGAIEYIESVKLNPLKTHVGKKVVVIGGGNTAMDAASEAARLGAEEVYLLYRRSKEDMKAYEFELKLAKSVGAQVLYNTHIHTLVGENQLEAIVCHRTEIKNGKITRVPQSEFRMSCDMLIRATGQERQTAMLDLLGLDYDADGRIKVNKNTFQCSKPNYFAGGDVVSGGKEVVNACAEGKRAARGIVEFLG